MNDQTRHVHIAIVGSGFGGLGLGIRLRQEGILDFVILERAGEIGGVWRDNTYPGCACDVQSHLYSFSFAPNPGWTRAYSPQAEILDYLRDCATRFGVLPHVRLNHEVREAAWDEATKRWTLSTSQGTYTADVFIVGAGALSEPAVPKLPGLATFAGKTFHSARWDHDHDLAGKKVAVIGTGASAIQFVPEIQPRVGKLTLFQRTPPWILPRRDRALSEERKAKLKNSPRRLWWERAKLFALRELMALPFLYPKIAKLAETPARRFLKEQIKDPALRAKLTPTYRMGCKRILVSDDYLASLNHANVAVVTNGIREVRPHGIVTDDGVEHDVDTIIFGTGFQIQDLPMAHHVRGRDGRTLSETWAPSPTAHLGTSVAGFPNFFFLLGPHTGLGHTSVILMIESQLEHILGALRHLHQGRLVTLEPRRDAQQAFVAHVEDKMRTTVWTQGGCKSWYLDASGRNWTLWPGFTFSFARRVERFEPGEYLARAS